MTLNLKTANQSSCMTLWPMMLHHHTKFGYRRFHSWGDIVQMNIHWNSEFFSVTLTWTTTEQSNLFKRQSSLWWCITKPSLVAKGSAVQDILGHVLIIWSFTVTLTLKTANKSFWKIIWLITMHHQTKFGSKRFSNSDDIIWTNIHWHFEFCSGLDHSNPISS